jgi:hypothetical protein
MNCDDANNNIIPAMINLFRYIYERLKIKKGEEKHQVKTITSNKEMYGKVLRENKI